MKSRIAALITCFMLLISQVVTTSYAGMYDGAVRDRASINPDNVSEKNYKTFSPNLSEDSEVIETQADLANEAAKTYESVTIDEAHFPSEGFRKLVSENFDTDGDGILSSDEIREAKAVVSEGDYEINSVKGIEYLANLKKLNIYSDDLNEVDVTKNPELQMLTLSGDGNITSVDTSKNTKLRVFNVSNSSLSSVDLTKNTELRIFTVPFTSISSVNLSNNPYLKRCEVAETQITQLDVTHNKKLQALNVEGTSVSKVDTSNNRDLYEFYFNDTNISSVDFSKNWNLTQVQANGTKLKTVDFSHCKALTLFWMRNTEIDTLDLSNNKYFSELAAGNSKLKALDVADKTFLKTIEIENTPVKHLDVSSARNLVGLNVSGTQIKKLDVSKNTNLNVLNVSDTKVKSLNIANNKALRKLHFDNTSIKGMEKVDAAKLPALEELSCKNAGVEEITKPVSNNISLWNTDGNKLKQLDLIAFSAYQGIEVSPQNVTVKGKEKNGALQVDIHDLVHDVSKVSNVTGANATYDAGTGVVTFGASGDHTFAYEYATGNTGAPTMNVNVKVLSDLDPDEFAAQINRARFIDNGKTLEVTIDRNVTVADDGKSKIEIYDGDPDNGGTLVHTLGNGDNVDAQFETLSISLKNTLDIKKPLYVKINKGALKDSKGKILGENIAEPCIRDVVVDSIVFSKTKFDSDGGALTVDLAGSGFAAAANIKLKLVDEAGDVVNGETSFVTAKSAEFKFNLPENGSEENVKYKAVLTVDGKEIDLAGAFNGTKKVTVLTAKEEEVTPGALTSSSLTGTDDNDPAEDTFEGTVEEYAPPTAVLELNGSNLNTDNVKIKAVDENGVEWPTTPVPLCNSMYRFQAVPNYVDPAGNKMKFDLMAPTNIGADKTYTITVSLDGGKTYLAQPEYKMVIHNNGYMGDKLFTPEQMQNLIDIEVDYVDESGNKIAESDHYKAYGVSEIYSLGIKGKKIDGYAVQSSDVDQELLDSGFVASLPSNKITFTYSKAEPNKMIEGNGSSYDLALGGDLNFRASAPVSEFESAVVTGTSYRKVLVEGVDFEKSSGSTRVKLKAAYLKTLKPGRYKLEVNETSGTATAEFTIYDSRNSASGSKFTGKKPGKGIYAVKAGRFNRRGVVQTGDNLPFIPFVIFGVSVATLGILLVNRRKFNR
nr:hypothetical protein [uncultured Mogibacterium sp.]